jgi:hypothetical protein
MMVFNILKLVGIDVPARIEAAKLNVEHRVDEVVDRVRHAAMEAAVIAALTAIAVFAAALAMVVGLIALYDWESEVHGPFAGLGLDGALLVAVIAICGIVVAIKSRSLMGGRRDLPASGTVVTSAAPPVSAPAKVVSGADYDPAKNVLPSRTVDRTTQEYLDTFGASRMSAAEAVKTLDYFLSKTFRFPTVGVPAVDNLMGSLRAEARSTAEEALDRVSDVVEHGNRTTLVFVLGGAVLAGWALSHRSFK